MVSARSEGATNMDNQSTRRKFGKLIALGASIAGFNPTSRSWIGAAEAASNAAFDRLPALDGTLHLDQATCTAYATDFGRMVHEQPIAVLQPGSVQDIVRMVQFARAHKLQIAA